MSDNMQILPGKVEQLTDNGKGNDLESYKMLFKALVKPKNKGKIDWTFVPPKEEGWYWARWADRRHYRFIQQVMEGQSIDNNTEFYPVKIKEPPEDK